MAAEGAEKALTREDGIRISVMLSDEEKYFMNKNSRQFDTLGGKAMENFPKASILIVGLGGVGVETAKNLVLAGPGRVVIHDDSPVQVADLGVNFLITKEHIGLPRSEACLPGLVELNLDMKVEAHTGDISGDYLSQFVAVLVTDNTPLSKLQEWDDYCHKHNILFVLAHNYGGLSSLFCDYGAKHEVTDKDGELVTTHNLQTAEVKKDKDGKEGLYLSVTADSHKLEDNTVVLIGGCRGMEALNGKKLTVIRVYNPLSIDDKGKVLREVLDPKVLRVTHIDGVEFTPALLESSASANYVNGGIFSEVKPSTILEFATLRDSAVNPKTGDSFMFFHPCGFDAILAGRGAQLHFARLSLWKFQDKHGGELPRLHHAEDAAECVALAKEILEEHKKAKEGEALVVEEIDAAIVSKVALYARAEMLGLCAFLGGFAAQEVVKKWGKTTPLHQWLHVDYLDVLEDKPADDYAVQNTRYDHQIALFGQKFQDKLANQTWFLVGCGALGCEYLKGFSLMGIGSGPQGRLHVTDYDHIELSNLTRQLLFRKEDLKKAKSVVGGKRARMINPDINVTVHEARVGTDTEDKFNSEFYSSLTGVCNALDNVKAREYTDSRCVFFEKPLLESGTLGTKCNSEVIIPHKTACYRDARDDDAPDAIPLCTLRNFPSLIEHCLEWSRSLFAKLFDENVKNINLFIDDKDAFLEGIGPEKALHLQKLLRLRQENTYEACIRIALEEFSKSHDIAIKDLTFSYPKDATRKNKETGEEEPFWTGSKRFPRAAEFNLDNTLDAEYLLSAANLYAAALGLDPVNDMAMFKAAAKSVGVGPAHWEAPKKKVDALEGEDAAAASQDSGEVDPDVLKELSAADTSKLQPLVVADFEKDDDTNYHIDFIAASANLRAWNYEIELCTRHKCKMIAGRITPALATTTALITGLVEMELCKLVKGLPKEKHFGANVNLAMPYSMSLFEPDDPKKTKPYYDINELSDVVPVPDGFTVWDKVVVDKGDLTLKQFLEVFPEVHHGVEVLMLYQPTGSGQTDCLWGSPMVVQPSLAAKYAKNEDRNLKELFEEVYGPVSPHQNYLVFEGQFQNKDEDPVVIPIIQYVFKK